MAEPFRPAPSKGGLGRSLRSKRTSTFESIEDLLATCERLRDVTPQAVDDVAESNGVELENRFPSDRLHLYRRYLAFCLEDRVLSEEENADLEHLCGLLHLETGDIAVPAQAARRVAPVGSSGFRSVGARQAKCPPGCAQ